MWGGGRTLKLSRHGEVNGKSIHSRQNRTMLKVSARLCEGCGGWEGWEGVGIEKGVKWPRLGERRDVISGGR